MLKKQAEILIWERARSTLTAVQRVSKLVFSRKRNNKLRQTFRGFYFFVAYGVTGLYCSDRRNEPRDCLDVALGYLQQNSLDTAAPIIPDHPRLCSQTLEQLQHKREKKRQLPRVAVEAFRGWSMLLLFFIHICIADRIRELLQKVHAELEALNATLIGGSEELGANAHTGYWPTRQQKKHDQTNCRKTSRFRANCKSM